MKMSTEEQGSKSTKVQIVQHTFFGGLWCAAWLFTIGYLHLGFWRGALAIFLWPYYIGLHVSTVIR